MISSTKAGVINIRKMLRELGILIFIFMLLQYNILKKKSTPIILILSVVPAIIFF